MICSEKLRDASDVCAARRPRNWIGSYLLPKRHTIYSYNARSLLVLLLLFYVICSKNASLLLRFERSECKGTANFRSVQIFRGKFSINHVFFLFYWQRKCKRREKGIRNDAKQVEMKTTKSPSLFLGYLHETGPQRQRWTLELRLKAGCQRGITYVKVCSGNDQMP